MKRIFFFDLEENRTIISEITKTEIKAICKKAESAKIQNDCDLPEYTGFKIVEYKKQWYAVSEEYDIIDRFPDFVKSEENALIILNIIGESYQKGIDAGLAMLDDDIPF